MRLLAQQRLDLQREHTRYNFRQRLLIRDPGGSMLFLCDEVWSFDFVNSPPASEILAIAEGIEVRLLQFRRLAIHFDSIFESDNGLVGECFGIHHWLRPSSHSLLVRPTALAMPAPARNAYPVLSLVRSE